MGTPLPHKEPQHWQAQIGQAFIDHKVVKVNVRGLKTGQKLDKKTGVGTNKATISVTGDDFASWTLELSAGWDSIEVDAQASFDILERVCLYVHENRKGPLNIYHPMLDKIRVNLMMVEHIEWPENPEGGGIVTAKFSCTEWAPQPKKPKNVAVTPGVGGGAGVFDPKTGKTKPSFTKPDPFAADKAAISKATAEGGIAGGLAALKNAKPPAPIGPPTAPPKPTP